MKPLAFLLAVLLQTPQATPLSTLRTTLKQLADKVDQNRPIYGATPELTTAKHLLRDWIESRLAGEPQTIVAQAFADSLHAATRDAGLLCDDCDWNHLGYVDDVRVSRIGNLLIAVTATGISCGYDESAYAYAWDGGQWRRVWEHEQTTYTPQGYLPQVIHDIQVSSPDSSQSRLLLTLGSQTVCGGAIKNVYARAWRINAAGQTDKVLDRTERANDEYPPIEGRLLPGDVLFKFTAGGFLDGDVHPAFRHFKIDGGPATQVDPIAVRPLDFVLEWLAAPWEEIKTRSESPALEAKHAELHRTDGAGDFSDPTRKCTTGPDLWQVGTHLFESPKRYYRVRWREPYTFTIVDISETPYPDCTVSDSRADTYRNLLLTDPR